MGRVNDYIKRILKIIKKENKIINKEKPWLQYYGDKIPESLNYFQGSIYENLKESAVRNESRKAYSYFGSEATYGKFLKKVDEIASALLELDIVKNESVTICCPNTPESIALIYALNKIGAIANIVHPLSTTQDIERALKETNSDTLFCSDVSMPKARNIKVDHFIMIPVNTSFKGILKTLYRFKAGENLKVDEGMLTWQEFLNMSTGKEVDVEVTGDDPAAIIYSGGTTGKPKGIIISNKNFNAMSGQTYALCDYIRPGNSVLAALPIFHVFGLSVCVHSCLMAGTTLKILPQINTKKINKELKKHKPNVFPAVPSLLKMVVSGSDPGRDGLSFLKLVVVGGDYLSPQLKKEMIDYLRAHGSNADILIGYGLSEATGFSCSTAPLDMETAKDGTLGIPNPDIMIKIFEPNSDVEKSLGDVGEICISGPTVMMGYINEDEETKKTIVTHSDGKKWLHTGDVGYMDKNGKLYYTSRIKRMIITNGYNVYPIELEDIICKHEKVDACTVIAIPHKIKNQTPKAVIVLKEGVEDTPEVREEIKRYCYKNIAKYAVPTEYEYRKSLPKTAVGKADFKALEKEAAEKSKKKED